MPRLFTNPTGVQFAQFGFYASERSRVLDARVSSIDTHPEGATVKQHPGGPCRQSLQYAVDRRGDAYYSGWNITFKLSQEYAAPPVARQRSAAAGGTQVVVDS